MLLLLFEDVTRVELLAIHEKLLCQNHSFEYALYTMIREDSSNNLRVLIATDCHLGYLEKDEIRRHDSFDSFEEICSIAEEKQVILSTHQLQSFLY